MTLEKWIVTLLVSVFLLVNTGLGVASDDKAGKINLNTATKEQLIGLGMDEDTANAVLEHRKENGEFVDIEELLDIEGIDNNMIRQLKKKIYIEGVKGCNC